MDSKKDQQTTAENSETTAENKAKKKPYSPPKLIEHGSLAELTQFGGSAGGNDFMGGKKS